MNTTANTTPRTIALCLFAWIAMAVVSYLWHTLPALIH